MKSNGNTNENRVNAFKLMHACLMTLADISDNVHHFRAGRQKTESQRYRAVPQTGTGRLSTQGPMRGRLALLGDSATGSLPRECQRTPDNIDDSSTARFRLTRGHCWNAPTPLRNGIGAPHQCHVLRRGVDSRLPLPRHTDVRAFR